MKFTRRKFWVAFVLVSSCAAIAIFFHFYAKGISEYLDDRGDEFSIQSQSRDAIIYFSWAVLLDPHNASAYFHRGDERLRLDDIKSASPDYDLAVEVAEYKSFYRSKRAELRMNQHLYPEALSDLNDNINELGDPDDYYTRGILDLILHKPKEARADFDAAIKVYPESKYLIARSSLEYLDRQPDLTVADLREAFKSEPPNISSELLLWLAQSEDPTKRTAANSELFDYLQANAATQSSSQIRIGLFLVGKISLEELLQNTSNASNAGDYFYAAVKAYFEGNVSAAKFFIEKCKYSEYDGILFQSKVEYWRQRIES